MQNSTKACGNWWWLCLYPLVSSTNYARSLLSFSVLSRAFVMNSLLELIISPLLGDDFSHLCPLPAAKPECPVQPAVEGWHSEDSHHYPIQWVGPQGWGYLRASPGFREFWFILLLLVVAYLPPTSFIGKIFSGLSGVGLVWVQTE